CVAVSLGSPRRACALGGHGEPCLRSGPWSRRTLSRQLFVSDAAALGRVHRCMAAAAAKRAHLFRQRSEGRSAKGCAAADKSASRVRVLLAAGRDNAIGTSAADLTFLH